ncbi:armadillo-type protein [Kockovaella imperatae]|uniref:Armadillo-type protein n=1 Tax=Kockovaella imperatae TaxID=4999 RepID=A0A1Y1URW8_9TREE|nr:armadillo-type protein [Kockovaella imperatae]ORX40692.1 armadillo-type protein [Kockovaella imperatae]
MNYLKSITTTVLNSTGVSFPFSIGERIPGLDTSTSIWDVREGVKKDDGTLLTLFIFDSTLGPFQPGSKDRKTLMQLARNALKKLRTIRHPDVIKYIDSVETETHVYIATERVRPLEGVLRDWTTGGALSQGKGKGKEDWIGWGIRSISTALAFLNSPPLSLHHAYLLPSSVFVTPAMEWRLGGFELLTAKDDSAGVLWGLGGVAPGNVGEISGPEVKKGGWGVLRDTDPAQADIYLLALLLFILYNPSSPLPNLNAQPTPSSSGSLPKALFPLWKRMLNPNPRTRLSTSAFVSDPAALSFWSNNPLANLVQGLDGFELKSEGDKLSLLRSVKDAASAGEIPQPFLLYKVLPSLLHSLSLPTAPSGAMLPLVLELGKLVSPADYGKLVLDPVVKLYASPDRGTRMALLDGLGEYGPKLDQRTVVDKVWPHLITGFADTVPVIREATVKAVYPLASKLNDRILNNDLLRLLAKMQTDTEPSIRTNTCILIGRLAPMLGPNTKKKVLVPAFARSLKDSFVHARVAGLMALMATVDVFDRDDLAGKVVPNMAFTLVDREKLVRDQAFKAMNMFLKRIETMAAQMVRLSAI